MDELLAKIKKLLEDSDPNLKVEEYPSPEEEDDESPSAESDTLIQ